MVEMYFWGLVEFCVSHTTCVETRNAIVEYVPVEIGKNSFQTWKSDPRAKRGFVLFFGSDAIRKGRGEKIFQIFERRVVENEQIEIISDTCREDCRRARA